DGDAHHRHVVRKSGRHLGEHTPQRRFGEPTGDEEDPSRICGGTAGRLAQRGSPLRTNLFGVPVSAPPAAGRHKTISSILRASAKSRSVMPPALCVDSFTVTRPQVTERSGW